MIRVSCGHDVPRVFILSERGVRGQKTRLYWCETCGKHCMSGHKVTGERSFDFLFELRDEVARLGVSVPDPGTEQGRAVVAALGARIR